MIDDGFLFLGFCVGQERQTRQDKFPCLNGSLGL
jgi:hypothetical protein